MRVLVACEFSGTVRDAFARRGHDAWSCDLLPSDSPSVFHIKGDVFDAVGLGWDLMVCHPPCTFLCAAGARWWPARRQDQADAIGFVLKLASLPIERIAIENPVGILSTAWRKPDQYIQPWQFGHGETKKTGLWLKGLPKLWPTNIVAGREARIHRMSPGPNRWRERSKTYTGIAEAMAEQWGDK